MTKKDTQALKEMIQVGKQRMSKAAYDRRYNKQLDKNRVSFGIRKDLETNYPLLFQVLLRRHEGDESIDLYDYMLARDAEIEAAQEQKRIKQALSTNDPVDYQLSQPLPNREFNMIDPDDIDGGE